MFSSSISGERNLTHAYSANVLLNRLLQQLSTDRIRFPHGVELVENPHNNSNNNTNNENPLLRLMTRDLNSNDYEVLSELDDDKKRIFSGRN